MAPVKLRKLSNYDTSKIFLLEVIYRYHKGDSNNFFEALSNRLAHTNNKQFTSLQT